MKTGNNHAFHTTRNVNISISNSITNIVTSNNISINIIT